MERTEGGDLGALPLAWGLTLLPFGLRSVGLRTDCVYGFSPSRGLSDATVTRCSPVRGESCSPPQTPRARGPVTMLWRRPLKTL